MLLFYDVFFFGYEVWLFGIFFFCMFEEENVKVWEFIMFCKRKVVVDEDEDLMKIEFEILEEVDVVLMFD